MKRKVSKYYNIWTLFAIAIVALVIAIIFRDYHGSKNVDNPFTSFLHTVVITSGIWIGCMTIVRFLWRRYPWEKYPAKHIVIEVLLILAYTLAFSYGLYSIELKFGLISPVDDVYIEILIVVLITLLITSIHEAIEFYKQWKFNFSKSVRLEKDNIEAKYETLKSQINPHFLFNSLNSLTTIVEDNERAVEYIQNLSEFLRYILKSRDRELVLVRDEITILNQYLNLQKSRFKKNLNIQIDVHEKFYHFSLPPLVLQMLVENCINHNVISKEKPLTIEVKAEKDRIYVKNNLQKKADSESTGNGLKNITERFKFFTTSELKVSQSNSTFKVSIPLLLVEL